MLIYYIFAAFSKLFFGTSQYRIANIAGSLLIPSKTEYFASINIICNQIIFMKHKKKIFFMGREPFKLARKLFDPFE
jgi:hypothetical protein